MNPNKHGELFMQRYKIQPNDNLSDIAQRSGSTLSQLIEANPQISNPDMIYIGEKIDIPEYQYIVLPGDNLYKIAQLFGVPIELLIEANPQLSRPYNLTVGQEIIIPKMQMPMTAPRQVETLESNLEDIIDDINNNDWQKAIIKMGEINNNFIVLKPMLQAHMISKDIINKIENEISNLQNAVESKNAYQAKVHANLITGYIPDILDFYKVEIPTDVSRLEYLGRAIVLDIENNNWDSANANFQKAVKIWDDLEKKLSSTYNNLIDYGNQAIVLLKQSINSKDAVKTTSILKDLLNKVDALKADYMVQMGR